MPVSFLLSDPKIGFFAPQGRLVAPINVKFSAEERTLSHFKFHVYRGRNTAPNLSKFWILAINLPLRGHSFAQFLRNSRVLYASIQVAVKFLIWLLSGDKQPSYKHFPAVGAFSFKISKAPSGETTDGIKKSWGKVQKLDGPPLSPRQVWWGSWVARRL